MLMYSSIYALRKVGEALPKKGLGTALVYGGTVVASVGGVAYSTHAGPPPAPFSNPWQLSSVVVRRVRDLEILASRRC